MRVFVLQPEPHPARRNCLNFLATCPDGMTVEISEAKGKRSSQANRHYWAVLNQISEDGWIEGRKYSADVWHECMKRRFIGCIDIPGGGSMAESSANLNISEFAQYTQMVEVFAATELGIVLIDQTEPQGRTS